MAQLIFKDAEGKAEAYRKAFEDAGLPIDRLWASLSNNTASVVLAVVRVFGERVKGGSAQAEGCDTHRSQITLELPVKELFSPKMGVHHMTPMQLLEKIHHLLSEQPDEYEEMCNNLNELLHPLDTDRTTWLVMPLVLTNKWEKLYLRCKWLIERWEIVHAMAKKCIPSVNSKDGLKGPFLAKDTHREIWREVDEWMCANRYLTQ